MSESSPVHVCLGEPRLMAYAMSGTPAWLWSADATRVLWANPPAAAIFNAPSPAELADGAVDPKSTAAQQVARIAATLPQSMAPRLERLRGFGGRLGGALMCACSRITFAEQTPAILIVSTEPVGPHLALGERARRLLVGCDEPVAIFNVDGSLLHATPSAKAQLGDATTLVALGVAALAAVALTSGSAGGEHEAGQVSLQRMGTGASTVLLARFAPHAARATTPPSPPCVESGEPGAAPATQEPQPQQPSEAAVPIPPTAAPADAKAEPQEVGERRRPLRFVWQMDVDGRLTIDSEEFITLLGPRTAAELGRAWTEIAAALKLDAEGQIVRAIAARDTFSGITVHFPVDTSDTRLVVELSGLPMFDRDRNFCGYRGFGLCRDLVTINELLRMRRTEMGEAAVAAPRVEPSARAEESPLLAEPPSQNVVPFPSAAPNEKSPGLTAIERKAFSELANRLAARLRSAESKGAAGLPSPEPSVPPPAELPVTTSARESLLERPSEPSERAEAGAARDDQRPILDRLPVGVLVYRLDKLIYANRAFLDWAGYGELQALEEAGGLDALFIEPNSKGLADSGSTKSFTIATNRGNHPPVAARLFTSVWQGESALVLMLAASGGDDHQEALEAALRDAKAEAGELRAILDTATDGVILFDRGGRILSVNRSVEALFGREARELCGLALASLLAPESQPITLDYLNSLNEPGMAGVFNDGCEVLGRTRAGGLMPLFMTIGTIADGTDRLCAVLRDIGPWKKAEEELISAKRQAENASSAKSDFLAKISHEIRTPLNAIIGFSEVMMQERFGPIGNDRYRQYLRDIKASGDHLVSLLNDLLDLSKIEAGRIDLNFVNLDLNEITRQCVALMQPQANRARVIIRTALAPGSHPVMADARSVRQIVLNLLSNSIKFTGAGGQIIVSTAFGEDGDAILRVRDTGVGMTEQDIAAALDPFRQLATSTRWGSGGSGLGLPLTKALAEANGASFRIKSAVNTGTLVEIAFRRERLAAE
jgi:PAS domain S-box-containing protein